MMKIKPKRSDIEQMLKGTTTMSKDINKVIHRSEERGYADHGWLKARHSFSFASWYNPDKVHFGVLRVLNDDQVAPDSGFPTHPHDNMEIITIPLKGSIYHKDSMGHEGEIKSGEVQVMSAGSGVLHSEFNKSKTEELNLFQIWIFPDKRDVEPRYAQMKIDEEGLHNSFIQLVSPKQDDNGLWIHQNAWISKGQVDEGKSISYQMKSFENGAYIMVIDGEVEIDGVQLSKRDAIGITGMDEIEIKGQNESKVLVLDVPMNID